MDIEEAKKRKVELEAKIFQLVSDYQSSTGTRINAIEIEQFRITRFGSEPEYQLDRIEIDVLF